MIYRVLIQHAADTGRYHPAYYELATFPGGMDVPADRYKSKGHHTSGFETLEEAQVKAAELAGNLPFPVEVPADGFPIREMDEAGADVLLDGDRALRGATR